jgi:hypothetical protein
MRPIWQRARYAWAVIKAYFRLYFWACRLEKGTEIVVQKAVAVNEDNGHTALVSHVFELCNWEQAVRVVTGWTTPNIRADVRYTAHGHKYRMVLRPGDPTPPSSAPERHRGGPKGVMAAELRGSLDSRAVDITRRVLKYQGPARDFHSGIGQRVAVADMFPFDDMLDLAETFRALLVVDSHARTHIIPLDCDNIAQALRG